jgi:hypothetical protein
MIVEWNLYNVVVVALLNIVAYPVASAFASGGHIFGGRK